MNTKDHKPIDYSKWDFSGQGKNILDSLLPIERRLWKIGLPHQDKRKDIGHAETVLYFALKSLPFFPNADREVVIPGATFHDTGYDFMTEEELALLDAMNKAGADPALKPLYNSIIRKRHEKKGKEFAIKKLTELKYPSAEKIKHIGEIISQHDTRKGFFSLEDKIVRDADKLWRVVYKSILMNAEKLGKSIEDFKKEDGADIHEPEFYGTKQMYEVAKIEMENTLRYAEEHRNEVNILLEKYQASLR